MSMTVQSLMVNTLHVNKCVKVTFEKKETYVFLFGLRQIIGQKYGIIFVDVCRDFIESGDESMLDPVHKKFGSEDQKAIWG